MNHHIYGGASFPFVTAAVRVPVVRWIVCAVILAPIAIILSGLAAIIWYLV